MKTSLLTILVFSLLSSLHAQDTASSSTLLKYKFSISYGIYSINPENINDHISTSNTVLESTTPTIKSIPEIAATFSVRPMQNNNIIILRGGYMSVMRTFQLSVPETDTTAIVTGYTTGSIKETYSAYPLSIGVGLASSEYGGQFQIEFIYGLGYIKEEVSYISSIGQRTAYSRSLFSSAYGFRIAGQMTVRFSDKVGLTLELGYRRLEFEDYEDETSTQPTNINFSCSGINGSVGLSIIF